jgi:hypothetical protein
MTALAHREAEGELSPKTTVATSATAQREGAREVTLEVEYRATQRLREYIVKGFTLDDERLKRGGGSNYFDDGQLDRSAVVARHATTAEDGKTYEVEYYNLDVMIFVGYRVKSHRGQAVSHLGDAAAVRVHRQGIHPGRQAAEARRWRQLLRRAARADPRHPVVGEVFWRKVLDMVLQSHFLVGKIVT